MQSLLDRILTVNLIATTGVFYVAARIYLLPQLGRLRPSAVLIPILLLHALRHLGLVCLWRRATCPGFRGLCLAGSLGRLGFSRARVCRYLFGLSQLGSRPIP